jgi:cyanate permease
MNAFRRSISKLHKRVRFHTAVIETILRLRLQDKEKPQRVSEFGPSWLTFLGYKLETRVHGQGPQNHSVLAVFSSGCITGLIVSGISCHIASSPRIAGWISSVLEPIGSLLSCSQQTSDGVSCDCCGDWTRISVSGLFCAFGC